MRVIHVIASVGDEAAGPSYSVPRLCEALAGMRDDVRLMSVGTSVDVYRQGFRCTAFSPDWPNVSILNRMCHSRRMASALRQAVATADIVHGHGLWLMPNIYSASAARRSGRPLVVSPRGMLQPQALAISRLTKRGFWYALQGRALRTAACFHATSIEESVALRKFGLRQPIAVIPNGIDLPDIGVEAVRSSRRVLLYLGRIHPIKNLESLIDAWSNLEARFPGWDLRMVGGHEKYVAALKARAKRAGVTRMTLTGPVYGADKAAVYRAADLYVLPSKSENFAVTVAEALAAGTPVITTKGTPWAAVQKEKCGWWIDHGAEALTAALAEAMATPRQHLAEMGTRGRDWMAREFSWRSVALEMHAVYEWLTRGGERPSCVEPD